MYLLTSTASIKKIQWQPAPPLRIWLLYLFLTKNKEKFINITKNR